jgi:formylglycine-generating enzyme required for sulfatase activity
MKKTAIIMAIMAAAVLLSGCGGKGTRVKNEPPTAAPYTGGVDVEMVFVMGGKFTMGCLSERDNCDRDEWPQRGVTLSDFSISKYEVTQGLWKAVMGDNPSEFKGDDNLPVETVSWDDIQAFIKKLNAKTGMEYRLPSEAEWEYAARGGRRSNKYKYAGGNDIDDVAWYEKNSGNKTHPVGTKQANELGIHDMSGNVWEWVNDWIEDYIFGSFIDPAGPPSGDKRVIRGGSWTFSDKYSRVSNRFDDPPDKKHNYVGFRLALGPAPKVIEDKPVDIHAIEMVLVEGGTFSGLDSNVAVSDFYIGKYEVTQGLWELVMGNNPSYFYTKGKNFPVDNVSWEKTMKFIERLNEKTGKDYRLPSEAEWEYAARGGNQSKGYEFSGSNTLSEVAWCCRNFGGRTHLVGTKQPNELGIYDMSGNVAEWMRYLILSSYGEYVSVYRGCNYEDPWPGTPTACRISYRDTKGTHTSNEEIGFRLAHDAKSVGKKTVTQKTEEAANTDTAQSGADALDMVLIEDGGTFKMRYMPNPYGDDYEDSEPVREEGYDEDLEPVRRVRSVSVGGFYIGRYEVTQRLWKWVMGNNPSRFTGNDDLPVEQVSWNDIQDFLEKLKAKTGRNYRLPTSTEWEYAARGGGKSRGYKYSGSNNIGDVAWYGYDAGGNSGGRTHPVGTKQPNELGIHDMTGNVWEWVEDGGGYTGSDYRRFYGCAWYHGAEQCKVSDNGYGRWRDYRHGTLGFRLALDAEKPTGLKKKESKPTNLKKVRDKE